MAEIAALLYVNQYVKEKAYDLIILDCAPTAESIRFISLPKTVITSYSIHYTKLYDLSENLKNYMYPGSVWLQVVVKIILVKFM